MSVGNLASILVRAIEARDQHDPAMRAGVYQISRGTLERFLAESVESTAAERGRQRRELEYVIQRIEAHYGTGRRDPIDLTELLAPPQSEQAIEPGATTAEMAPAPIAPPAPAAPSPTTPAKAAPLLQTRGTPATSAAVDRGEIVGPAPIRRDPPPGEVPAAPTAPLSAPHPKVELHPPAPSEPTTRVGSGPGETASEAGLFAEETEFGDPMADDRPEGGDEQRLRNRRGVVLLIFVLLMFGLFYMTDLGTELRRTVTGEKAASTSMLQSVGKVEPPLAGDWSQIVLQLEPPADPTQTAAFLWDETVGPAEHGTAGRVTWTRLRQGPNGPWTGRLTLNGRRVEAEIAVEPDEEAPAAQSQTMLAIRFTGLPDTAAGTPVIHRIDPQTGRAIELLDAAVRIGIDSILIGYRPTAEDRAADQLSRSVLSIAFALETDRQLRFYIRLPPPD